MTVILSLIAFAVLFAAGAALRPRSGCSHDCGACGGTCGLDLQEHS